MPTGNKISIWKSCYTTVLIKVWITIAKAWNQLRCAMTDDWMKNVIYMQYGILFRQEKEWNHSVCSKMDGMGTMMLSKINQTQRTNITCFFLFMEINIECENFVWLSYYLIYSYKYCFTKKNSFLGDTNFIVLLCISKLPI